MRLPVKIQPVAYEKQLGCFPNSEILSALAVQSDGVSLNKAWYRTVWIPLQPFRLWIFISLSAVGRSLKGITRGLFKVQQPLPKLCHSILPAEQAISKHLQRFIAGDYKKQEIFGFFECILSWSLPRVPLPLGNVFHHCYLTPADYNKKGWLCKNKVTLGCQSKISSPQITAWALCPQLAGRAARMPLWGQCRDLCCPVAHPSRNAAPTPLVPGLGAGAGEHLHTALTWLLYITCFSIWKDTRDRSMDRVSTAFM